jgi:S-adenosylmethionine-dependent methyltransferase
MDAFLRRGRGVSYHEFDLTFGKAEHLKVLSSLTGFLRRQSVRAQVGAWRSLEGRYERLLKRVGPAIHEGFYHRNLDLIIEKC